MWDEMVDVVAVGAGPAGLACAVAAAANDLEVFVATPPKGGQVPADSGAHGWLPRLDDPETAAYLDALIDELPTIEAPELAKRNVYIPAPVDTGRRAQVDTFVGSRLWDWAARCLGSPYGVMFTRVAYWPTVAMRTTGGSAVEVATLAEVTAPGRTLSQWLEELAAQQQIEIEADTTLQRLVFGEEGRIEGVVLDTANGPLAVQARIGVAVSPGNPVLAEEQLEPGGLISLVGQRAGRFGRLEVLREVDPPA
ncbi:FAD-binding protein [Mycobacterium sp. C31M]